LVSCQPPDEPEIIFPTPLPTEPITVYIGALDKTDESTADDMIALLVSETRVRAMLCSLSEDRWQALDTWFGQGERNDASLTARSDPRQAQITAALDSPESISGDVQLADGTRYHFQAQRMLSTADYEAGVAGIDLIGVYTVPQEPLPDGRIAVFYAAAFPAQNRYCGMLLHDDQPVTRVLLNGPWQASFSLFTLPDPIGTDILVWETPRHIQRIEGILLPKP
jgi:hypothetical protein